MDATLRPSTRTEPGLCTFRTSQNSGSAGFFLLLSISEADAQFRARPADACSAFKVHWEITYIKADEFHYVGEPEITDGVDYVSAVLENNRWRLCASDFSGVSTNPKTGARRLVEW